ncbi:glutamate racemase [Luteimonas sp. J16]|jgi:glutamate racemase|nr:glutamate racemase [Luteimonas sp. J16]
MSRVPVVGVFDSGVGGLTVLARLRARLPAIDFLYLGDTARVPYGTRSAQTIVDYTRQGIRYLQAAGVDLVVVACNTASAVGLPALAGEATIPVVGVVEDGVLEAVNTARRGVLVLATPATIAAGSYQQAIHVQRPNLAVEGVACPLFVPLAEEGWGDSEVADAVASRYLASVDVSRYDLVLLGCTHFPLLAPTLRRCLPDGIVIEDPGPRLAERVAAMLGPTVPRSGSVSFEVTDSVASFARVAGRMGMPAEGCVKHLPLAALTEHGCTSVMAGT